ncbi:helix-turn-helix transcriptional regulator [Falsihalocynthiibacter sp. CO-5D18]|uniref:helix-turn-helix transcriptional regulator n=1 Tax=Falsihalocynthiibacter sp. CO-5D18 TaxID=3240872 RepID=UPI00350FE208
MSVVSLVEGIAGWCQAVQGVASFRQGLKAISMGFGAKAATLVKAAKTQDGKIRSISVDLQREAQCGALDRSFADLILGSYIAHAKVGSVWYASMAAYGDAPELLELRNQRALAETVVIVLGQDGKWVYLLELHFANRLSSGAGAMLTSLCDTLCQTWSCRSPGVFSESLLDRQPETLNVTLAAPLLSDLNPAGLSRAEFRVCLLLSHGLNRDVLAKKLKISSSTLRSHLRQIYDKAECRNLSDLLRRLLLVGPSPAQETPLVTAIERRAISHQSVA